VEVPAHLRTLGLPDFRQTITTLVRLQAAAVQGGSDATNAYVAALQSSDLHVTRWGAATAYQRISQPSSELADAYLRLWSRGDPECQGAIANAVIEWKLRRAGPVLSAALRQGGDSERASAAHGLGGTGDGAFVAQLRAATASDPSKHVRSAALGGLVHLLGSEVVPDLLKASQDRDPFVRNSVALEARNLSRKDSSPPVNAALRRVLQLLLKDSDRDVRRSAQWTLERLEVPR
jgi:HEAT repeat protein